MSDTLTRIRAIAGGGQQLAPPAPGDAPHRDDFLAGRAEAQSRVAGGVDWDALLKAPPEALTPAAKEPLPAEPPAAPVPPEAAAAAPGILDRVAGMVPTAPAWLKPMMRYADMAPGLLPMTMARQTAESGVPQDVAKGLVEAPLAIVRGAAGAVEQLGKTANAMGDWLNAHVADLNIPMPSWLPAWAGNPTTAIEGAGGAVHEAIPERQTVTGGIVETTAQWLTSAALLGKLGGAFGVDAGALGTVIKNFAAGAAGFDPHQGRLSQLVQGITPNPVTEFLAGDPKDPELEARLKAGLETGGLGVAAEGVVKGLGLLRDWMLSGGKPVPGLDQGITPAAGQGAATAPGGASAAATEPGSAAAASTAATEPPVGVPNAARAAPSAIESLDPKEIRVDAERFQFKSGADAQGVTDRLAGVTQWDPMLGGTALVWRDADGANWIADGHQRLALAQRLTDAGQQGIKLNAFVLDAKNGVTAEQARGVAATKNIAEGTGTAIDAAKVMREAAAAGTELPPMPPRSTLVRDGADLAKLSANSFGMAVNEVVPANQAAIVGRLVQDPAVQDEAMRVLAKLKPANAGQAEMVVRDVLQSGTTDATQTNLFGTEAFQQSVTLERAKLVDQAQKMLRQDKQTFGLLVDQADQIGKTGGNVLDTAANQARLSTDEQAAQLLYQLATRHGDISDALTGIARRLQSGDVQLGAAAREFLGTVRGAIEKGLDTGADAGGAQPGAAGAGAAAAEGAAAAPVEGQGALALGKQQGQSIIPQVPAPPAPLITIDEAAKRSADAYLNGETGPGPVRVNIDRIQGPDEFRAEIERAATTIGDPGVESHDAVRLAADAIGMDPESLLRGWQGRTLPSAAEFLAMRETALSAWNAAIAAAKLAADPATASPAAKADALRAVTAARTIGEYVANQQTGIARALAAMRIQAGTSADRMAAIQRILDSGGGDHAIDGLMNKLAALGDPVKASRFAQQAMERPGESWFMTVFYNALLSNPRTVLKKLISDVGMGIWNTATHYAAERIGGSVPSGETAALAYGYTASMRDALAAGWDAMKAGESQFRPEATTLPSRASAIAATSPAALSAEEPIAAGLQYLRAALPTSWIAGADDWAKVWQYRANARALLYREAAQQGLAPEDIATHVAQGMDNTPEAISAQAWEAARRLTFQTPLTGFAKSMQTTFEKMVIPTPLGFGIPVGKILMPFIKVPANIAAWSYRNTGLALMLPTQAIRAEIDAGGATRDLALARMGLGSMVALAGADLVLSSTLTGRGPSDPQLREAWLAAGNRPYSIRLGSQWYGYNHMEPVALLLGAIADGIDAMRFAKEEDTEHVATSVILGAGNAMLSKTYFTGISAFFNALNNPDHDGARWSEQLITAMATPAIVAGAAVSIDPWLRAHYGLLDALQKRIPFLSEKLPPARTLWGDPIPLSDGWLPGAGAVGAARAISPVETAPASAEPVDKWIWDNRAYFPHGDQNQTGLVKPGMTQSFSGGPNVSATVPLEPRELDRFIALAGNGLKDPRTGMGAKDTLNALVTGKHPDGFTQKQWNEATPEAQAMIVQDVVRKFRGAAKQQLQAEFPDLADAVKAALTQRGQTVAGTAPAAPAAAAPSRGAAAMPTLQ